MNRVQKRIRDIVSPMTNTIGGLRLATIRSVNYIMKTATIVFEDHQDLIGLEYQNVPMVRQQGTHEAGPFPGDQVLISFFNNDFRRPVIIGSIDMNYGMDRAIERDSHLNKGANISDLYCLRDGEKWNVE